MNTQLVALSPTDLAPAQQSLLGWCDQRIKHWLVEQKDAKEAYEYAVKQKWNGSRFRTQMQKAGRKLGFYRKVRRAVELGYLIVPNLPLNIIAIRTDRTEAKEDESRSKWSRFEQSGRVLPAGEGSYKSPIPARDSYMDKDKEGKDVEVYFPTDLQDELEVPVRLQKPEVLRAVDQARAHKLFDEIGVCDDASADPIVCGVVREGHAWNSKRVTFFLAWYIDLNDI